MKRLLLAALILSASLHAQHVANPRASLIDVPARQKFLAKTTNPILLEAKQKLPSCLRLAPVPAPPTVETY